MNSRHDSTKYIGKYRIIAEIGRGGMGVVYKALDPYIERTLAIKTIKIDSAHKDIDLERWKKRFLREAQLAGKLSHQNIVTIHDVGEGSGLFYIAMEYVPGQSLREMIDSRKKIPLKEAQRLMGQICDAISYAHKKGVIHCDIKPDNILLDENENIIIVDFGIARTSTSNGTQTIGLMVTPSYAAPERIGGEDPNASSDIFSIGATLYEMVTGQKPFPGDNVSTVIKKILYDDPQRPTSLSPDLPQQINLVLAKALAKDPLKRYQSCEAFYNDLINYKSLSSNVLGAGMDEWEEMTFSDLPIPKKKTVGKYLPLSMSLLVVIGIASFAVPYVTKNHGAKKHNDYRVESSLLGHEDLQKADERAEKYFSKISTQEEKIQLAETKDTIINISNQGEEHHSLKKPTIESLTPKGHVSVGKNYLAQTDNIDATDNLEHKHNSTLVPEDKDIGQDKQKTVEFAQNQKNEENQNKIKQYYALGSEHLKNKNYSEAVSYFNKLLKLDQNNSDAKRDIKLAKKKLEQKEDKKRYYSKGLQLITEEKYSQAVTYLEKVLALDNGHSKARKHLKIARKKAEEKESIERYYSQGLRSFNEHSYAQAKFYFREVLNLKPGDSEAKKYLNLAEKEEKIAEHFSKGVDSYNEGNFTETISQFNEVLKLNPSHTEAKKYIEMAKLESMDKRLDKQTNISAYDQGDAKLPKGW
jgi:serine/threonine protein kinase/outer membrane protein assembly factor BamD (BamD/ComL family)